MSLEHTDTIVALASGTLPCGVAVIRVSGPSATVIANTIIKGELEERRASLRTLYTDDGQKLDQALVVLFAGPHSYTGEDVVEFHAHGSVPIVRALIDRICQLGARHARAGEFTERAFFNNRIDLVQAEAVGDLIGAQSLRAAQMASNTLRGLYTKSVEGLRGSLTDARVHIEGALDFPEEDIQDELVADCAGLLREVMGNLDTLIHKTKGAIALSHNLKVVLIGEPNSGKSSLINLLSEDDLAIVSPTPGTTRDAILARVDIGQWSIDILDTAGIRRAVDDIEQEGVARACAKARLADRIWWVRHEREDEKMKTVDDLYDFLGQDFDRTIPIDTIYNKIDLSHEPARHQVPERGHQVWLSCKTGVGQSALKDMVDSIYLVNQTAVEQESEYSARRRHADALLRAREHLVCAQENLASAQEWVLVAEELRLTQRCLDEILGVVSSDDLLGEIFSRFCIGK